MKTTLKTETGFQPITIELTFETQAELDIIGTMFNVHSIASTIEEMGGSVPDARIFEEAGGSIDETVEFSNALKNQMGSKRNRV